MGFKPVDHRVGAVFFTLLFIFLVAGILFYSPMATREYHMAFLGSLVWVLSKFSYEKGLDDKNGNRFDYFKYMDAEWDNLAINVVGIFIVVPQMHNIAGLQDQVEYSELWYYAAGIICDGVYILVVWVAKMKKKYTGEQASFPEENSTN